jgi:hypothetical protein
MKTILTALCLALFVGCINTKTVPPPPTQPKPEIRQEIVKPEVPKPIKPEVKPDKPKKEDPKDKNGLLHRFRKDKDGKEVEIEE